MPLSWYTAAYLNAWSLGRSTTAQRVAQRNAHLRCDILSIGPSLSAFSDVAGALAVAGRSVATVATYGREFRRLRKYAIRFHLPPITGPADVSRFLSSESSVTQYLGYLANCGFAYASVHKILFALRATTAAPGVVPPPPFSRYTNLVLKGFESVVVPGPSRPIITIAMYHFCSSASLSDLLESNANVTEEYYALGRPLYHLARWRAMAALAFFGALRRSEYLSSALLNSCVSFDNESATALSALAATCAVLPFTMRDLWCAVVASLRPKALLSVNIVISKCNPRPEMRFIERDAADPMVCPVAAIAFWMVLRGVPTAVDTPFFAFNDSADVPRGPSADEVLEPLRLYLLRSNLMGLSEVSRVSLHAFRHGGASGAVQGGATREQTKCLGRWRGDSDAIYTATTKDIQGLAASSAISIALGRFSKGSAKVVHGLASASVAERGLDPYGGKPLCHLSAH